MFLELFGAISTITSHCARPKNILGPIGFCSQRLDPKNILGPIECDPRPPKRPPTRKIFLDLTIQISKFRKLKNDLGAIHKLAIAGDTAADSRWFKQNSTSAAGDARTQAGTSNGVTRRGSRSAIRSMRPGEPLTNLLRGLARSTAAVSPVPRAVRSRVRSPSNLEPQGLLSSILQARRGGTPASCRLYFGDSQARPSLVQCKMLGPCRNAMVAKQVGSTAS